MIIGLQNAIIDRIHAWIQHTIAINAVRDRRARSLRRTKELERISIEKNTERIAADAEFLDWRSAVAFEYRACDALVGELVKRTHDNILRWYKDEGHDTRGYSNPFIARPRRLYPSRRKPLAPRDTNAQQLEQINSESAFAGPSNYNELKAHTPCHDCW